MKFDGVSESSSEYNSSITSTSTVRRGGLSTSTTKSQNKTMHRSVRPTALEIVTVLAATR
ncbi:MAG: hypothetical protein NTV29_11770 [Planctomycetota bacterium]|nr:hypothetical protein [Planctomycetota bacterium]